HLLALYSSPTRRSSDLHRVRADDGRYEGDRDPLDRLPPRARVREEPGTGGRSDPQQRQDRAACHDRPPPRCPPVARPPEGVRGRSEEHTSELQSLTTLV